MYTTMNVDQHREDASQGLTIYMVEIGCEDGLHRLDHQDLDDLLLLRLTCNHLLQYTRYQPLGFTTLLNNH